MLCGKLNMHAHSAAALLVLYCHEQRCFWCHEQQLWCWSQLCIASAYTICTATAARRCACMSHCFEELGQLSCTWAGAASPSNSACARAVSSGAKDVLAVHHDLFCTAPVAASAARVSVCTTSGWLLVEHCGPRFQVKHIMMVWLHLACYGHRLCCINVACFSGCCC